MGLFLISAITQDTVGVEFSRCLLYQEYIIALKANDNNNNNKPVPCSKAGRQADWQQCGYDCPVLVLVLAGS